MCNALAMNSVASLGQIGAGTAGAVVNYNAIQDAGKFNRRILEKNRQISLQQAELAKERGAQAVSKHRQQVRSLIGRQRAAYAASGVLVGTGTPQAIVEQSREFGAQDEAVLRRNTDQEIWAYQTQAENLMTEMAMWRRREGQAGLNAALGIGFNFLDAAGRFGTAAYQYQEKNAPPSKIKYWGDPWK